MSHKSKGCDAERELIHLFWQTNIWTACRVAGSGSMHYPAPDILAAKEFRRFAIECKSCKDKYQYVEKREIEELKKFSQLTNSEPIIALRFIKEEWIFLVPDQLKETDKNFVVSKDGAKKIGKLFKELIK